MNNRFNSGAEVREALELTPCDKKWGVYGSMFNGRRRDILSTDLVPGLFFVTAEAGCDGWMLAGRRRVEKIEGNKVTVSTWACGQRSFDATMTANYGDWPHSFIANEQTDEVLYELYKKNVFKKDYAKAYRVKLWDEYNATKHAEAEELLPLVEQAIKDGKASKNMTVVEERDGVPYYSYDVYVNGYRVMGFGFHKDKEQLEKDHGDDVILCLADSLTLRNMK